MINEKRKALTVGVLVTNYNSWSLALNCVQKNIELHGNSLSRIVLLDDASPIAPHFSVAEARTMGFDLVRNPENLGFAATLNKGIELVGTDIVVVFDADAYPLKPYFDIIMDDFLNDDSLALMGMPTVGEDSKPTESSCAEPTVWGLLWGQKLSAKIGRIYKKKPDAICLWMCSLVIRAEAFNELGRFDQKFDLLDVDIDLCMRVNASRWKLRQHPELLVFHEGGGTPMNTGSRLLRFYANRWRLLRKHNRVFSVWFCRWVVLCRLYVESLIIRFAGKWMFAGEEERIAKADSRRRLIDYCHKEYV